MIQYRPGLIEGCLDGTGLTLDPEHPAGHHQSEILNTAGRKSKDPQARIMGDRPIRGTAPWRHARDNSAPQVGTAV
jgi:hypothetical protein